MSKTIDERVVEMRFDNKQFEQNVQTSISSIEKLEKSLNLKGASKGLDDVNAAAKNCNMTPLSNAVETVKMRFSALEVMAVTALANITNSALNAGKNIVSALTIDPIKTGFQEYETQINAVQTILANTQSKGTTIDQVNAALDELNKYADQTIYNFTEMTRNIGTFTAAGVDLDKSVTSIKGIANLAAASGSNAYQASTAMYQLSQAIATGKVSLQDWNSVVNAGMGGQLFQDALTRTAEHFGTNMDAMIEQYGSFRASLTEGGWLTTEVLTETLTQLSGAYSEADLIAQGYTEEQAKEITKLAQTALDAATKVKTFTQLWDTLNESVQSGWTQSWEIIIGDFEEAKELLTEVSNALGNMVNASAEARNKMLQDWKDLGGRTALIEAVRNAFEGVLSIIKPVREAFREVFPPMTGEQLYNLTVGLQELTEKFKIGEETANNLKRTFKGVFALFDIGLQGVKALVGGFADLIGYVAPAGDGILGFTASIGDFIVGIDEAIKSSDTFNKAIEGIGNFLKPIADGIKTFVKTVADAFSEFANVDTSGLDNFADKVQTRFEPFVKLGELVKKAFEGIIGIVANAFGNLGEAILTAFDTASFDPILDLINTGLFSAILIGVKKFIDSLSEITENGGGILGSFKDILDGVKGSLEAWQSSLKAGTLLKIAGAMAILTAAIVALSLVDSEKLNASLGALSVLFVELLGSMAIFEKIMNGAAIKGMGQLTIAMIGMSTAVLILAGAVQKLSGLDWDELLKGLVGVAGLSAILVASATALSKTSKGLIKGSAGLVVFAAAIRVLVGAVEDLGALDVGSLAKGLIGVGVLCTELALFLKATDLDGMGVLKGTGLVLLAASINILANAVGAFGALDISSLLKGLSAVAVVLTELAVFTKVTANAKHVISTATAMTILGAAMLVFGEAVEKMGNLTWGEIGRGLTTMAGSMAAVTVAMNLLPKGMVSKATGMVEVGAALLIIGEAVRNMGGMSWDEIARGLVTLAGSMTILVVALNAMKTALPGAAAVLTVSAALAIFTPVLKSLGNMSWESIAKGLVALAGSFTVLGVAGVALGPLTPAILGLSAAIAVLGVGCLAAGAGILAFSTGLSALAVSGAAGAASLVVAVSSILSLIPLLFESIGEGILSLAGVIANGGPAIAEAFTVLVLAAVEALVTAVPAVVDGLFVLVDSVLSALVEHTPTIVEQLFDILIGIIQAITTKLPELIKAGVELLMAFFDGVIDALSGIDVNVLIRGIAGIGLLSAIMLALSAVASLVPGAMLGVLGMGAVIAELALVLAAVGALAQIPGLEWLIGEGGNLLQGIGTAIGQFVGGIVGGFMSGVSSQFPQIGADLAAFMVNVEPFIQGATQLNPSMLDGVKALAETILILTAADILNGLTSWLTGGSSLSDFATQLVPFGEAMRDFSIAIAGMDGELVANAATAGRTLAEMAATLPNSGGVIGFFTGENDMHAFGEQLIPFGEAMMGFATAVTGLNPDTVINASIAGKAIAEMATTIPNSGGVVGFFAGENDMQTFGEQLIPFGLAMKGFSLAVEGLKVDAIVNSATAGKALMELANTVPNSGGVVGFFTGENDMDTFGEKLVPFGRAMKSYSDAIAGIDVEAVTNSATAGKAVVELANTLPNTGGLVSWFTGDNDIAAFGTSLVSFGKSFAQYSDYMKDVDANIVTTTTNAATSIVELQKSLPKEGGWFSDDMTLSSFGSDMASFGAHFSNYYNYISGVKATILSEVITQTNRLVSMARGMVGLDTSGMTSFSSALTTLGQTGVTGFINSFHNAESRVKAAASSMITGFINGVNAKKPGLTTTFNTLVQAVLTIMNGKQGEFQTSGSTLMVKFVAGVRSQDSVARTTFLNIISGCLTTIQNKYWEFTSTGTQLMVKLIAGIRSQDNNARMTFTTIMSACLTAIENRYTEFTSAGTECMARLITGVESKEREFLIALTAALSSAISSIKDYYGRFHSAGSYLVDGFCDGISERTWKAEARARAMARAAAEAAEEELDENSPSKRFYGIGNFAGIGFINALADNIPKASKAGQNIAKSAIDGLGGAISKIADYIDTDMEIEPTIRPVLDLSVVESEAGRLNTLFSRNRAMSVSLGMNNRVLDRELQNEEHVSTGNTYQFTQNNYSPKALSRIDIYRQTKNQFSAMKGLVDNA
ncbi:tape measure protein [[Clostridium] symbiosum]|uniref:tape measure protein n=1 Tax=Clostridium symbiosum TaxID=1512 RepID=UPI002109CB80|nr:tape measure protein [[Clostridium] symbiosum]MCQ4834032.1 tape measure protein [[Clostridium] symbiosum]